VKGNYTIIPRRRTVCGIRCNRLGRCFHCIQASIFSKISKCF
jgi:hypothetical protein